MGDVEGTIDGVTDGIMDGSNVASMDGAIDEVVDGIVDGSADVGSVELRMVGSAVDWIDGVIDVRTVVTTDGFREG